jgi:SUN domain-containing protein 1/2
MAPTSANPTHAWASQQQQQQQQRAAVNRSTSVEYESQVHTTNLRRLGGKPPSRTNSSLASGGLAPPPGAAGPRRVVPRTDSLRSVPDSEPEAIGRARSPLADAASALRQGVSSVVSEVGFIMRARSREPEGGPPQDSYDYSAEEREIQAHAPPRRPAPAATTLAPRKSKISADNMAYKPSQSDYEDSEEEGSDGGKRKRRRKKGAVGGGPLTNLPVAGYDKKRRRRRGKNDPNGPEEEEEDDDSAEQVQHLLDVCVRLDL